MDQHLVTWLMDQEGHIMSKTFDPGGFHVWKQEADFGEQVRVMGQDLSPIRVKAQDQHPDHTRSGFIPNDNYNYWE